MFKNTFIYILLLTSIVLFIFTFIYLVFEKSRQADVAKYYQSTNRQLSDLTSISEKTLWQKKEVKNSDELLAGNKIDISFTAKNDNLGTIAVPFNTHGRSIPNKVIFKVKEKNKKNWLFQSTYNTAQFQNNIPFPFGFPIIKNSKDISYTFEIESLNGSIENSVSLSRVNPYFFAKYKFSKSELIKNPGQLTQFLVAKTNEQIGLLTVGEGLILFLSFLIPYILYILYLIIKLLKKVKVSIILNKIYKIFLFLKALRNKNTKKQKDSPTHMEDRINRIRLACFIISIGFFSAVLFHYFQGWFYKQTFPFNTFLPNAFFGDFLGIYHDWDFYKFNEIGYAFSYFPGTYPIIDLIRRIFSINVFLAIFVILSLFTIFLFIFTYKHVKTKSKIESLQYSFIISMMSYPFLFSLETANIEIFVFIFICLFFIFYKKYRVLGSLFLAYAISMKVFPAIFLVLYLLDKRYKYIFLTCFFAIIFMLFPLIIYDGGFNKGIDNYFTRLVASQNMYSELMIFSIAGTYYGHSILNGISTLIPSVIPHIRDIILPYDIFALSVALLIIGYLFFFEGVLWKRVACIVIMMNLLPFTSTDYKLLYIYLPLLFLINNKQRGGLDYIFVILFSLLLIPKYYFYFNGNPLSNFNIVANPLIMLLILFLIIISKFKPRGLSFFGVFRFVKKVGKKR